MFERSNSEIPILNGEKYHDHYFHHRAEEMEWKDAFAEHFGIYNRCALRENILPHRLDFYMIFLVTSGEGIHSLGSQDHYLRKNMLCFVGPNIVNSWRSEGNDNRGYLVSFSDEFFSANRSNRKYLADLPFFQLGGEPVFCLSEEKAEEFSSLFSMMEKETKTSSVASPEILRGYLQVLIGKAMAEHSVAGNVKPDHPSSGLRIVKAFTDAYMSDFNALRQGKEITLRKISDYAKQLGVSQNHLNDTVKAVTGMSAGQLMKNQLLKQASVCLKHSKKSISEIAYLLGFEDPSYFSRFYKKQTGKLPSDLRPTPVKSAIDSV